MTYILQPLLSLVLSDAMDLGGDDVAFLKFRAGYSQVAGGADSPYQLKFSLLQFLVKPHLGASLWVNINGSEIPNSEITPFEKNETEFGVDLRMFDNKLSIDATYYDNETSRRYCWSFCFKTSGYSSALANLGKVCQQRY